MDKASFVKQYGSIYEHSPWVAEAAWDKAGGNTQPDALHPIMKQIVDDAPEVQKLALLRAHPMLACAQGELTEASQSEQAGAGLKHCSAEEFAEFQQLNANYVKKFAFPFIVAVKGLTRQDILVQFRKRIHHAPDEEFATALAQVHKIARLRLEAMADA